MKYKGAANNSISDRFILKYKQYSSHLKGS